VYYIGGPATETKIGVCQNEHRPHYRGYRNTSRLFIGVNLLKTGGGGGRGTRIEAPTGLGVMSGEEVYPLSSEGGVWGSRKKIDFILRNVELLCILDPGARR